MIFPLDVYSRAKRSGTVSDRQKGQIFITLYIILDIVLFFVLITVANSFFSSISWIAIAIFIVLNLTVGVMFFRIFIFKEKTMIEEYQSVDKDAFSRYFAIRKEVGYDLDLGEGNKVFCFELEDSSLMCVLELRFGSNSNTKFKVGYECLKEILKLINFFGYTSRVVVMTEDFTSSSQYREYVDKLNSIEDMSLKYTMKSIFAGVMQESYHNSDVEVIYLELRAKGAITRSGMTSVLKSVLDIFDGKVHCFRQMHFLDMEGIKEYLRRFYKLEILDLSILKSMMGNEAMSGDIMLCQLVGHSGNVYKTVNELVPKIEVNRRSL
jgi:hypothetical protein